MNETNEIWRPAAVACRTVVLSSLCRGVGVGSQQVSGGPPENRIIALAWS